VLKNIEKMIKLGFDISNFC